MRPKGGRGGSLSLMERNLGGVLRAVVNMRSKSDCMEPARCEHLSYRIGSMPSELT